MHPLVELTKVRIVEFVRQPEAVFWVYVFPILMTLVLGLAFRSKSVETYSVLIEEGPRAQKISQILEKSESPKFKLKVLPEDDCQSKLRVGKTSLVIGDEDGKIAYFFDPARPGSHAAKSTVDTLLQVDAGRTNPIETVEMKQLEPGGRYIDFLVPGLLGMGLMGGGLFGVGFGVVDLRIRKLLKLLLATPMKRSHFLASLMISRMFFLIPEVVLLLVFSWAVFGVTIYGSWFSIIIVILLGSLQFSGVGLLVASRAKTLEGASGLLNLVMLPMWTLCGIFFSYENFPEFLHPFIKILPLTPIIDSLRGLMLEGVSIVSLWPELLTMGLWGICSFAIALKIFRWSN